MEFTEKEIEMIQEMIDFPTAYNLTDKGIETIQSIYNKIKGNH